jgi:hypothetical protein
MNKNQKCNNHRSNHQLSYKIGCLNGVEHCPILTDIFKVHLEFFNAFLVIGDNLGMNKDFKDGGEDQFDLK